MQAEFVLYDPPTDVAVSDPQAGFNPNTIPGEIALIRPLVITGGTEHYEDLTGTIVAQIQNDFFTGVGTLALSGEVCFDGDDDSESTSKRMQSETNARGNGTIA